MSASAKLYARVTESSLMQAPKMAQLCFFYLLAIADRKGQVIGTDPLLAKRICFDPADFTAAVAVLAAPDADSSSKAHDGRRLLPTDEPRGYRIVNYRQYQGVKAEKADPEHCPTNPLALKIAEINNRRATTPWADKEIETFKRLVRIGAFQMADLEIVHRYYDAERRRTDPKTGEPSGYHRRALSTFLNSYLETELDRAREWARRNPKAAAAPLRTTKEPAPELLEPEGFRAWFTREYSKADPGTPFGLIPQDIRRAFQP